MQEIMAVSFARYLDATENRWLKVRARLWSHIKFSFFFLQIVLKWILKLYQGTNTWFQESNLLFPRSFKIFCKSRKVSKAKIHDIFKNHFAIRNFEYTFSRGNSRPEILLQNPLQALIESQVAGSWKISTHFHTFVFHPLRGAGWSWSKFIQ